MKSIVLVASVLIAGTLLSSLPLAGQFLQHRRKAFRGGGGTPWTQDLDTNGTATQAIGDSTLRAFVYFQFQAANSGAISTITVRANEAGTPNADTFDFSIYPDDGADAPDEIAGPLANGTINNIAISSLPDTVNDYVFSDAGFFPTIASGSLYHLVFHHDNAGGGFSLSVQNDVAEGTLSKGRSNNGTTWTELSGTTLLRGSISGAP